MQRSISLDKINVTEVVSNARNSALINSPDIILPQRKRLRPTGSVFEHYCITIKPKLYKSSSLSELTTYSSDFKLVYFKKEYSAHSKLKHSCHNSAGDAGTTYCQKHTDSLMSWNFKGKKPKKKSDMSPESYASKFAAEYLTNSQRDRDETDVNPSSCADNSSTDSTDQFGVQKGAAFPFKSTPSGNLKVQSNQVVFQSSTVGVLLADPTQAKVKVKFEGKAAGEPDDDASQNYENEIDSESILQYGPREVQNTNFTTKTTITNDRNTKPKTPMKEELGRDLGSLGYGAAEPIDWMRVQLPKKQDLFQEFYRRIHNYM